MSSFTTLLIIVVMVQFAMILFSVPDVPGTALYTFITNPSDWDTAGWNLLFADVIAGLSAVTIILGLYFIKSDFIVFAGTAGILYSFGKPLVNLFITISAQSDPIIAVFFVSPIIVLYIMAVISWWRGSSK